MCQHFRRCPWVTLYGCLCHPALAIHSVACSVPPLLCHYSIAYLIHSLFNARYPTRDRVRRLTWSAALSGAITAQRVTLRRGVLLYHPRWLTSFPSGPFLAALSPINPVFPLTCPSFLSYPHAQLTSPRVKRNQHPTLRAASNLFFSHPPMPHISIPLHFSPS